MAHFMTFYFYFFSFITGYLLVCPCPPTLHLRGCLRHFETVIPDGEMKMASLS